MQCLTNVHGVGGKIWISVEWNSSVKWKETYLIPFSQVSRWLVGEMMKAVDAKCMCICDRSHLVGGGIYTSNLM